MNLITPVILIIISIGTFFMYIDPNYQGDNLGNGKQSIKALLAEDAEYQNALNNTAAIGRKREALIAKKGQFSTENLTRLEKLLPDNIDNIKLVIDMNRIAQNHTLVLRNVKLDTGVRSDESRIGQDNNKYGTVGLSFTVSSSYTNFQNFLNDLERSLRLVDITSLSVKGSDTNIYDFSVELKTYWLK